jgi:penicillin amidase
VPSLWYLAELNFLVDGKPFHFTGGSMSSLPLFLIGKTDYFTWGLTSMHGDNSDLYYETIR